MWFTSNVAYLSLSNCKYFLSDFKLFFKLTDFFFYLKSVDKLVILPDGKLRHFIKNPDDEDDFHQRDNQESTPYYYDHEQGQYCMEKVIKFVYRN